MEVRRKIQKYLSCNAVILWIFNESIFHNIRYEQIFWLIHSSFIFLIFFGYYDSFIEPFRRKYFQYFNKHHTVYKKVTNSTDIWKLLLVLFKLRKRRTILFFSLIYNFRTTIETMKLFDATCSSFAVLGISPRSSCQKYPFNAKILWVYLCYWLEITLHWMYLSRNAHNLEEYSDLIFRLSSLSLNAGCYTVYVMKAEKLFQNRELLGKIIDESKKIDTLIWVEYKLHQLLIHIWLSNIIVIGTEFRNNF